MAAIIRDVAQEVSEPVVRVAAHKVKVASQKILDSSATVIELEQKELRDGRLSSRDTEQLAEQRIVLDRDRRQLEAGRAEEAKLKLVEAPGLFETSDVTDGKANVVQYHLGQVVSGKRCPRCGSSMMLRFSDQNDVFDTNVSLAKFFWGCVHYFAPNESPRKCSRTSPFGKADMVLLHESGVPELELSHDDLHTVWSEPFVQKRTVVRLGDHLRQEDKDVLCPIHHTPMQLRQKKDTSGPLLDHYYLRCSALHCHQMIKLKSPAQLASFLKRATGEALLS